MEEEQLTYQDNDDDDLSYISADPAWESARFVLPVTQEQSLTYVRWHREVS